MATLGVSKAKKLIFLFKNLNFFIHNLKFIYQNSKIFPRATPGTSAGCLCNDLTKME